MDRVSQSANSPRRSRIARRVGWGIAWLALGIAGIEFLLSVHGKYAHLDSDAYDMFLSRRGWLWVHLAGGALTILLGPLQFLTQWRRAWPRTHRWTGRIYMTGLLIACTGATGLIATSQAPFAIRSAFAATALAWLATALSGLVAIRRGAVRSHQRWMTRNYLVTLAPVIFRIMLRAAVATGLAPTPATIAVLLWLSWVLPLLVDGAVRRIAGTMRSASRRQQPMVAAVPAHLGADAPTA